MHRVVIGESLAHDHIAPLFYQTGPGTTIQSVARYLGEQMEQGRSKSDDPRYAAVMLLSMVRGQFQMQLLMHIEPELDEKTLDRHVRKVVNQFLALYAT